jgi:hypothetical protein
MIAIQKPGESVLDYTNRIDRLVQLALDLGCTWHDLGSARRLQYLPLKSTEAHPLQTSLGISEDKFIYAYAMLIFFIVYNV